MDQAALYESDFGIREIRFRGVVLAGILAVGDGLAPSAAKPPSSVGCARRPVSGPRYRATRAACALSRNTNARAVASPGVLRDETNFASPHSINSGPRAHPPRQTGPEASLNHGRCLRFSDCGLGGMIGLVTTSTAPNVPIDQPLWESCNTPLAPLFAAS